MSHLVKMIFAFFAKVGTSAISWLGSKGKSGTDLPQSRQHNGTTALPLTA